MGDAAEKDHFEELFRRLEDLPEGHFAEIVAGDLRVLPRPGPKHARAASRLDRRLGGQFDFDSDGPGGWVILVEPDVRLGDELRAPDLAGWRLDHYREPGRGPHVIVPDWICEVLSDRTRAIDRVKKQRIYHRAGVAYVWHVDPEARTLEVFRREDEGWTLLCEAEGDERLRAAPFVELELELARLWSL